MASMASSASAVPADARDKETRRQWQSFMKRVNDLVRKYSMIDEVRIMVAENDGDESHMKLEHKEHYFRVKCLCEKEGAGVGTASFVAVLGGSCDSDPLWYDFETLEEAEPDFHNVVYGYITLDGKEAGKTEKTKTKTKPAAKE